jgi:hypothetical protein
MENLHQAAKVLMVLCMLRNIIPTVFLKKNVYVLKG